MVGGEGRDGHGGHRQDIIHFETMGKRTEASGERVSHTLSRCQSTQSRRIVPLRCEHMHRGSIEDTD